MYSIHAVKQENFDDVDFAALNTTVEEKANRISLEDEAKAKKRGGGGLKAMAHEVEDRVSSAGSALVGSTETMATEATSTATSGDQRGLLLRLTVASKLYRHGETSFVARAPPVDRVGSIGDQPWNDGGRRI